MKQTKPEFRTATAADVRAFYGGPSPYTMRAYVVLLDVVPVALGGVTYRCGVLCAFSEMKEEFRPYKVSIMKFARKIREIFGGSPGMAVANPREPGSGRLLRWLGFEYVASCDQGEVYKWPKRQSS